VSSLARASRTYVGPRRRLQQRLSRLHAPPAPSQPNLALSAGIVVAVVATAFASRGGSQLERTTWTELAVTLVGAGVCALALVLPRPANTPARLCGAAVIGGFGAFAVYTALSITWSLMPNDSWLQGNQMIAYLAALAGGLALGRLAPDRWSALLIGIAVAAIALSGWSLLTKVFPAALAADELYARLRPPSDYWNSVGLTAALGIPPLLWLASRRSGHSAINALAWPGLGFVIVCMLLSYSRGALLAVALGLAVWFAFVPLRLRALIALASVTVVTLPIVAWAFAQDGLATDGATMALRVDAGQGLGALLLLMAVGLTVAGLAVGFLSDVKTPSSAIRARASRTLIVALAVVPAVAVLMLANAPGGIDGQVSKAWKQATDPAVSGPSNDAKRLTETSSGRARYWREAMKVHAQAPWLGTGAGAYGTLRLRYRVDQRNVQHAHGFVVQTLADLGWVGLALALFTTGAWIRSAARAAGMRRKDRGLHWDAERVGIATLATVVLVFGIHSTVDWTWFVPANALPALICAGWVASRPSLRARLLGEPADATRPGLRVGFRFALAATVMVIALLAAWSSLQPVRSVHAQEAALERLDIGALPAAASIAQIAHERNPLAVEPLFELSAIQQAQGRDREALKSVEQAVDLEPANPETWRRLGQTRLNLNDPKGALAAYQAAFFLDPKARRSMSDVLLAARAAAVAGG
jgi:hypothetical protein